MGSITLSPGPGAAFTHQGLAPALPAARQPTSGAEKDRA